MKLFFILLIAYSYSTSQEVAPKYTFLTEIYPPANYIEEGKLVGASVEILQEIYKHQDWSFPQIEVLPWSRAYETTLTKPNTVLFTMSRTPLRDSLFKWVGPVFTARHVLVGIEGQSPNLDSLNDAKKYQVGVIDSDISEVSLLEGGFSAANLQVTHSIETNLRKLINKRIDFVCISQKALEKLLLDPKYAKTKLKSFTQVNEIPNYIAFNKDTPEKIIQIFQETLMAIKPKHNKILKKYKLHH